MGIVFVALKCPHILVNLIGGNLAVVHGQGHDLVPGEFDGTGLVYVDMTGGGTYDAFKAFKHRINNKGIGLGAPGQEADFSVRSIAKSTDLCLCPLGDFIRAVTGIFFALRLGECVDDFGAAGVHII